MNKSALIVALAMATLACAGCRSARVSCAKPQPYQRAESVPALKVPAGLDAPNTSAALRIPELATPEQTRQTGDPCLDEPPPYATAKETEPPA